MNHRYNSPQVDRSARLRAALMGCAAIVVLFAAVAGAIASARSGDIGDLPPLAPAAMAEPADSSLRDSSESPLAAEVVAIADPNALEPCWAYWKVTVRC